MREAIDILLIEDNPGDVELIKAGFEEARIGNMLRVISDGQEAVEFFNGDTDIPDLVLLDINLPKVNGIEVLKVIRGSQRSLSVPVIMLTSSERESDILESYREHVNSFISKPVDFDKFIKVIQSIESFWLDVVRLPSHS